MRKKIAVLACSSVLSLSLAAAVLEFQRHPDQVYPGYEILQEFDPTREGGHLLPDMNLLVRTEKQGVGVRWITNSKGFRNDREFSYEKPSDTYRILFVGDSFVDGHRTEQDETIGYLLERGLEAALPLGRFQRCEVLISGHNNPTTAWYHYQEHGRKYGPDLVLLGLSLSNDITWNNYGRAMEPVQRGDGAVALEWNGVYSQDGWKQPELYLPDYAYCDDATLAERLALRGRLPAVGDGAVPDVAPGKPDPRHVPAAGFSTSLGLYLVPPMAELEDMTEGVLEVLRHFSNAVRRDGAQFLLALFPIRLQVHESDWQRLVQTYALDEQKFDLLRPNRRIGATLAEAGLPWLDLQPVFADFAARKHEPLYRQRGDQHFNERGQALAAEALLPVVRSLIEAR